ncbi:MAG: hypothetical protein MHPSP_001898, partial [Paramarteilia canceri]
MSFKENNSLASPFGALKLLDKIGKGTYGTVFKAKYLINGETCAVKTLEINDENEIDDILNEIKLLKEFNHPNLISLTALYRDNDEFYLVMDYCICDVDSYLKRNQ